MRRDDAERAEERLRVLTSAMRTFTEATSDLDQLLDLVARSLTDAIGDSCVLLTLTDDGLRLAPSAAHAVDPEALERVHALVAAEPFLLETHPTARAVMESRTALLVPKVNPQVLRTQVQTTSAYVAFQRDLGIHSLLAVPLQAHGKPLGLLTLTRYRPSSPSFDEADRDLATNLADHASMALANAQLYVAERKARLAAEAAMRSQANVEARFARLAEVGLLGVIVTRLDGTVIDVNPYVEKLLGVSREKLVSKEMRWGDLTPREWRDIDARAAADLAKSGATTLREKEYMRADGTLVPVLVGSARVGEGPDIISFILDLRERKQFEATLARVRALVEAAPDAIIVTDTDQCITVVNGQTERLLGYSRAELDHAPISRLIPPSDGHDLRGRRKDGSEFPLEVTLSQLETEEGPLVLRSLRDVTERKNAEQILLQAKDAAESANRELESFSYSVAHDLRTPLRGMNGFAQILLNEHASQLDDDAKSLLQRIIGSATKMSALIDGLLALARLNRTQPKRETVDLSALVRATIAQALAELPTHPATELAVEDDLVAFADPTLLAALVDNLIGNAVKFTRRTAAPRIELGHRDDAGPDRVYFLRDNGAGFDMKSANLLFAPFQRLHSPREFPGTGIGLATVQRIVARHGGRIWAEGKVGAGATIYFTLPSA